jgi:uncharacterized protein (TIGR02391 family)
LGSVAIVVAGRTTVSIREQGTLVVSRKPAPSPQPANLTIEQVKAAIPKLERRVAELTSIDVERLTEGDFRHVLDDHRRRIDDTLVNVFGHDTVDYYRYMINRMEDSPGFVYDHPPSIHERRPYIKSGVASAISKLNSAISVLKERLEDSGETAAARAVSAYKGLDLHPEIARAASRLYQDGHYSTAVEHAVKALNGLVRLRSSLELDGTSLMERAFSPSNPIIRFNDLSDQSDKDEQKGFMMMFSGAVSGLRNPRAHGFIRDKPERALEFIAFVSLLAKLLDEAKP